MEYSTKRIPGACKPKRSGAWIDRHYPVRCAITHPDGTLEIREPGPAPKRRGRKPKKSKGYTPAVSFSPSFHAPPPLPKPPADPLTWKLTRREYHALRNAQGERDPQVINREYWRAIGAALDAGQPVPKKIAEQYRQIAMRS